MHKEYKFKRTCKKEEDKGEMQNKTEQGMLSLLAFDIIIN